MKSAVPTDHQERDNWTIDDCQFITLPTIRDTRGDLTIVEGGKQIPFDIRRAYYLYHIPENAVRGGHGHKALHQFLIALAGQFNILLDDGLQQKTICLDNPNIGLYIPPSIWRVLEGFSEGAICLSLVSDYYNESDYYRDYQEFLAARGIR